MVKLTMLTVIQICSNSNCDSPKTGDFNDLEKHTLEAMLGRRQR